MQDIWGILALLKFTSLHKNKVFLLVDFICLAVFAVIFTYAEIHYTFEIPYLNSVFAVFLFALSTIGVAITSTLLIKHLIRKRKSRENNFEANFEISKTRLFINLTITIISFLLAIIFLIQIFCYDYETMRMFSSFKVNYFCYLFILFGVLSTVKITNLCIYFSNRKKLYSIKDSVVSKK